MWTLFCICKAIKRRKSLLTTELRMFIKRNQVSRETRWYVVYQVINARWLHTLNVLAVFPHASCSLLFPAIFSKRVSLMVIDAAILSITQHCHLQPRASISCPRWTRVTESCCWQSWTSLINYPSTVAGIVNSVDTDDGPVSRALSVHLCGAEVIMWSINMPWQNLVWSLGQSSRGKYP